MIASPAPRTTAFDVIAIYNRCEATGIHIWIDGGWGVDALLGKQTRTHADLDIATETRHVAALRQLLEADGYEPIPRDDASGWNFVLGDTHGHLIDVHAFVFNKSKCRHPWPAGKRQRLPTRLTHRPRHNPEPQSPLHSPGSSHPLPHWLPPRETDRHGVKMLSGRFNIPLPDVYR